MPRVHPAFMQTNFNEWICMYQSIWCIYSRLANRLLNSISCSILPLEIWVHNAHRSALIICCVSYRWGWYYAAIENLLLVICGNSKLASTQLSPPPLSLVLPSSPLSPWNTNWNTEMLSESRDKKRLWKLTALLEQRHKRSCAHSYFPSWRSNIIHIIGNCKLLMKVAWTPRVVAENAHSTYVYM